MIQDLCIYGVENKLKLIKACVLLQKENKWKIYSIFYILAIKPIRKCNRSIFVLL